MKVTQSCLTLCDPVDHTVHAILQDRTLERVAFPFSRGSFQPRNRAAVSRLQCRQVLYQLSYEGSPSCNEGTQTVFMEMTLLHP